MCNYDRNLKLRSRIAITVKFWSLSGKCLKIHKAIQKTSQNLILWRHRFYFDEPSFFIEFVQLRRKLASLDAKADFFPRCIYHLTHTHLHTHPHTRTHTHTHAHTHTLTYTHSHTLTYTHTHTHTRTLTRTHTLTHSHTHTHTHTRTTNAHTHTRTHAHTHSHRFSLSFFP